MDIVSRERRSTMMSRIRAKDTGPEIVVRRIAHRLGFRFRLHGRDLPGTPDIVFPRHKKIIFVHGCYWHRHKGCKKAYQPKSNVEFWQQKFTKNLDRDRENQGLLQRQGWQVLVIWECETQDEISLGNKLLQFLKS